MIDLERDELLDEMQDHLERGEALPRRLERALEGDEELHDRWNSLLEVERVVAEAMRAAPVPAPSADLADRIMARIETVRKPRKRSVAAVIFAPVGLAAAAAFVVMLISEPAAPPSDVTAAQTGFSETTRTPTIRVPALELSEQVRSGREALREQSRALGAAAESILGPARAIFPQLDAHPEADPTPRQS